MITKNKLIKKFIIGSANFYQKYGANSVKIKEKEIEKILDLSLNFFVSLPILSSKYILDKIIAVSLGAFLKDNLKISSNLYYFSLEFFRFDQLFSYNS